MSDRDAILSRVRAAAGHRLPHPGAFAPRSRPTDVDAFREALARAAGELLGPMPRTEVSGAVGALCGRWAARRIAVTEGAMEILGEGPGTVVSPDEPPRDLSDVDVAVLRADHGVAENGAVALAGRDTRPRALHVLCQRAIVLLDVAGIVGEMHAAVAAASQGLARDHHLTWVSGPSKTADIESTLVIGAHGPRELVVLLFDA